MTRIEKVYTGGFILYMLCSYSVFILFPKETVMRLGAESGIVENIGVVGIIIGAVVLFFHYWKYSLGNDFGIFTTKRDVFLLLLAILFVFIAGEEISWGQRIFGLKPPEFFMEYDAQNEINIHNLEVFHGINPDGTYKTGWARFISMDFLFSLFWFSYCIVVPLLNHYSRTFRDFLRQINFPVVSVWIGALFLANYVMSKSFEPFVSQELKDIALIEVKESNFEVLFGIAGIYLHKMRNR